MEAARRRRLRRLGLGLGLGAIAVVAAGAWVVGQRQDIAWLRVQRVEVIGAVLLAPREVLRLSGIQGDNTLLDEVGTWEAALRGHPAIDDVEINRRLFSRTLSVRLREKEAIALVDDGTLMPATEAGEVLPIDVTVAAIDLPIVRGSLSDSAQAVDVHLLLRELGRLRQLDRSLIDEISEVHLVSTGGEVVRMIHPLGEILIPIGASPQRIEQLRAVLADLRGRADPVTGLPSAASADDALTRVDLRFEGQVVVHHPSPRELS